MTYPPMLQVAALTSTWHATDDRKPTDPKDEDGELPDVRNDVPPEGEDDAAVDHEPPTNPGE